jgi:hypothetical protein
MNMDNHWDWACTLRRAATAAIMVTAVAVVAGLTGSDPAAQDLGKAVPSETHSGWIGGDEAKSGGCPGECCRSEVGAAPLSR